MSKLDEVKNQIKSALKSYVSMGIEFDLALITDPAKLTTEEARELAAWMRSEAVRLQEQSESLMSEREIFGMAQDEALEVADGDLNISMGQALEKRNNYGLDSPNIKLAMELYPSIQVPINH